MRVWFVVTWKTIKVFLLFTVCTLLFYYGIIWISEEYENYHRYDEPHGSAIKVSSVGDARQSNVLERFLLFYLNGE